MALRFATSLLLLLCAAPAAAQPNSAAPTTQPTGSLADLAEAWHALDAELEQEQRPIRRNNAPAQAEPRNTERISNAANSSLWRTLGALAAVLALIAFVAWGYRQLSNQPGFPLAGRFRRPNAIEILARQNITPRQSIVLIRVGPRIVLVGQSPDRLAALDVIADHQLAAQIAGDLNTGKAKATDDDFADCFSNEKKQYNDQNNTDEPPAHLRVANTQDQVRSTLERVKSLMPSLRDKT